MSSHYQTDSAPALEGRHIPGKKKSHWGFFALVLLLGIGLAGGVAYQFSARKTEQKALAAAVTGNAAAGPPTVNVVHARPAPGEPTVELPGQTAALQESPIYTRTDGYVKRRNAEIGQKVKKGDLLVELDTPDLDQQIDQAKATLAQSKAALAQAQATVQSLTTTMKLAQLTASRSKSLAEQGIFARQDADDKTAAAESAEANLRAAEENVRAQQSVIVANDANVRRLEQQKKYARLEAPFDGVVTARNPLASDIGTLITSGSGTNAREIVRISQIDSLRVYVSVPQNYAPLIRPGQTASLLVDEYPGRIFSARVASSTNSLDPGTRTMQTLLLAANPGQVILPGMYVKVRFQLPRRANVLRLPSEALLVRSGGPTVAVVGEDGKVHITPVTLGRDYGSEVEIISGVTAGDRIVMNPSESIREGAVVEAKELPDAKDRAAQ